MDERSTQLSFFDQELVPAARGIRPGPGAMKDHGALLVVWCLQPQ